MFGRIAFTLLFQRIALTIAGVTVLIGGGVHFLGNKNQESYNATASARPWIKVSSSSIYLLRDDGSIEKDLHTGDDINDGDIIKSSATGRATIYLPDGSTLRIDKESTITIEKVSFNKDTETLVLRASLVTGRVWSKVIGLVTSDSSWEIKTSNMGVFVRGTSFLAEHKKGVSRVYVDSHKVLVKQIDPKSKLYIDDFNAEIPEKRFANIYGLQSTTTINVSLAMKDITDDSWIKDNQKEDLKIDLRIENLKKEETKDNIVREELRNQVNILANKQKNLRAQNKSDKEILDAIKKEEDKNTLYKASEEKKDEVIDSKEEPSSAGGTVPSVPQQLQNKDLKVKDLLIVSKGNISSIEDGGTIVFKVYTIMDDNSQKDVTDSVVWNINGNIGFIESPGVFKGKIRDEDSESGEIKGTIGASINIDGKDWNSKTIDITITPRVEETIPVGLLFQINSLVIT